MRPEGKSAGGLLAKVSSPLTETHRGGAFYFLDLIKFGCAALSNGIKIPACHITSDCYTNLSWDFLLLEAKDILTGTSRETNWETSAIFQKRHNKNES